MRFGMLMTAAAALLCAAEPASAARYYEFEVRGASIITAFANPQDLGPFTAKFDDTVTVAFDTLNLTSNGNGDFSVFLSPSLSNLLTMNTPRGPAFNLTFDPSQIAQGSTLMPLNVTGGFAYQYCTRYCGTAVPGQLLSFTARTTDIAPASLRLIERLEVTPVPEPATWGLMLLGFGAIGFGLRRRAASGALAPAIL